MVMCLFYSMLPVKNTFMYLAIMCQPVEDGSYKASGGIIQTMGLTATHYIIM